MCLGKGQRSIEKTKEREIGELGKITKKENWKKVERQRGTQTEIVKQRAKEEWRQRKKTER